MSTEITLSEIELFCRVCERNGARLDAVISPAVGHTYFKFTTGVRFRKVQTRLLIGVSVGLLGVLTCGVGDALWPQPWLMSVQLIYSIDLWVCIISHHYLTKYRRPKTADDIKAEYMRELTAYHEGDVICRRDEDGSLRVIVRE